MNLVTCCMNRNEFLYLTINSYTNRLIDRIIIVDYSSKIPVAETIGYLKDPRVEILRIEGQEYYDHAIATNTAIRAADDDYIIRIDCDVLLCDDFIKKPKKPDTFYTGRYPNCSLGWLNPTHGYYGTCLITKRQWTEVNGFHERRFGWGHEDVEFYTRLRNRGYSHVETNDGLFHIPHSREKRGENYKVQSDETSNRLNREEFSKSDPRFNDQTLTILPYQKVKLVTYTSSQSARSFL